ncbi:MAG: dual specificity protein phosphatase family protein [Thermoproteota archaeon]
MPLTWVWRKMIAASPIATSREDIESWKNIGVKAVVVLAESHEIARYWRDADNYFSVLNNNGLEFLHSPVEDFHAPNLSQLEELVEWIESKVSSEKPVLVHCHAGIGRTGTVIAAYLVKQGYDAAQAIREVKRKIPLALEVDSQVSAVYEYYEASRTVS